jgi:hypothetical protein
MDSADNFLRPKTRARQNRNPINCSTGKIKMQAFFNSVIFIDIKFIELKLMEGLAIIHCGAFERILMIPYFVNMLVAMRLLLIINCIWGDVS